MTNVTPITSLEDALKLIRDSLKKLDREVSTPLPPPEKALHRLSGVVRSLGQPKSSRPPRCPDEYAKQWEELISGRRQDLDPRAIRYLCWKPEAATTTAFQAFLDRAHSSLNGRSLQGLIQSCHARWTVQFAKSDVAGRVRERLEGYSGPHRLLQKWRAASSIILGPKAHEEFGATMVRENRSIGEFCELWGISDTSSPFVQMGVACATDICTEQADRVPEMRKLLFKELFPWSGWVVADLRKAVSTLILRSTTNFAELMELITRFVLRDRRLGDPRYPQNTINWIAIENAKRRVCEWLSSSDITFFFEHVLPDRKDLHGRKAFWLQYVGCRGLVSRPLLNDIDRLRLKRVLKDRAEQVAHFGLMESSTSAFLLDFGPVLVVEFSETGNACYVYDKQAALKVAPDFWSPKAFRAPRLKMRNLAALRMIHKHGLLPLRVDSWQYEMAGFLARYGIRPSL